MAAQAVLLGVLAILHLLHQAKEVAVVREQVAVVVEVGQVRLVVPEQTALLA